MAAFPSGSCVALRRGSDASPTAEAAGLSGVLLTTGEVAHRLGVVPATVVRWSKSGRLPVAAWTAAGQRKFDPADVDALLVRVVPGVHVEVACG
jgi:excisionase family DNA binding protein